VKFSRRPRQALGRSSSVGPEKSAEMPSTSPGASTGADAAPVTGDRPRGAATVLSDFLGQSFARAANALLSMASVILTTRLLLPRQYGVLAYISVISSLILAASCTWTSAGLARYGRLELDATGQMRQTSWARMIICGPIVAISCAVVLLLHSLRALPADFKLGYALIAIGSGVIAVAGDQIMTLITTSGRMKLAALLAVLAQGSAVCGYAVLAAAGPSRPLTLVAVVAVASNAVLIIPGAIAIGRMALWPAAISRTAIIRLLGFSWPIIAFAISTYIVQSVDIIILRHYDTAAATGIYAVAYGAYGVLQAAAAPITVVLTPLFVSLRTAGREDLVRRFVDRGITQFTLGASTLIGVAMCAVPVTLPLVYGHNFRGAARPLIVLCGALLLFAVAAALAPVLVLYERTRAVAVFGIASAIINIVGDVLLVGYVHSSAMGPAVATCGALACVAGGYLLEATRAVGGRLSNSLLLVLLPAAIGMALSLSVSAGILWAGASAVAVIASGLLILRTGGSVDSGDLELFARLDIPAIIRERLLRGVARIAGVDYRSSDERPASNRP
jgi:O-antigen/teichoic acid export membrane protein